MILLDRSGSGELLRIIEIETWRADLDEYDLCLCAEILELAGNAARDNNKYVSVFLL